MTGPYRLLSRAEGSAECAVSGANPALFLNNCLRAQLPLRGVQYTDATPLTVTLPQRELERARQLALRSQCELRVLSRQGGRALGRRIARRALPALCLLLGFFLLAWSKLYIWEIDVTGNRAVSAGRIRSALSDCGVDLGTYWPDLTSDNLRSELLARLPELAWATVNIYGSRAEVIVRERIPKPALFDSDEPVDLVAERLGFVTQVRALSGTAAVRPGSAVLPGDVLISGEMQSAFSGARQTHAVGTVTAETYYELCAAAPQTETVRAQETGRRSRWALLAGKKRMNFYRNSSFCPDGCDKIITIWECRIQGLFSIPLALVRETVVEREVREQPRDLYLLRRGMEQQLHDRLLRSVDDGEVEQETCTCSACDGRVVVWLRARCSENIAKERKK